MPQSLSPFHAELIEFIRNAAQEQMALAGFDSGMDLEIRKFQHALQEGMDPSRSDALVENAVDCYQTLFKERGSFRLEQNLLDACASQNIDAPLRIYRGLPRLYRSSGPSDFHVKKQFAHLPTLKRLLSEKWVLKLYEEYRIPALAKISFFTWVIGDGWGDYAAAFESIAIVKERFPDLELSWVALIQTRRIGSSHVPAGCKIHFIPYENQVPVSLFDREALEIFRTSDLIIQTPTFYPSFRELQKQVASIPFSHPEPKWMSIGEYGFVESSAFHPRSGNRSMGLHFLEKGILIRKDKPLEACFERLDNEELLAGLFSTTSPGSYAIEQYLAENHFYLAYLNSPIGGAVYLHALLEAHALDERGLDICVPDLGWLIRHIELQTQAGRPILEIEGISLELHHQGKFLPLTPAGGKKRVRIFCPDKVLPSDFAAMIRLSGDFVGVRGNQSFTEAVSANKGFFYDGREHARYFIKDLIALAENRIRRYGSAMAIFRGMGHVFLYNLPPQEEEWVEETHFQEKRPWIEIARNIGQALRDPEAVFGFRQLNRIMAEEHGFNEQLCRLIQRELRHRYSEESAQIEESAVRSFADGLYDLDQLIRILKDRNL